MEKDQIIAPDAVEKRILLIRGQKVMLDNDLALLYGIPTKRLNQQVRRNPKRFPDDFMFELTTEEENRLRLQNVTSNPQTTIIGIRIEPYDPIPTIARP